LNSLDINYQHDFLRVAKEFAGDHTTVVAILHDINLAIQYADELFFMKNGQIVAQGLPSDIIHERLIDDVFQVSATIIDNPVNGGPLVIFRN
jgi:iron complex transport system ATP-binding protein